MHQNSNNAYTKPNSSEGECHVATMYYCYCDHCCAWYWRARRLCRLARPWRWMAWRRLSWRLAWGRLPWWLLRRRLGVGCWPGIARRSTNWWSACISLLLWLRALLLWWMLSKRSRSHAIRLALASGVGLRVTKRGSPDQQVDHQNKEADDSKRRGNPGWQLLARRCVLCTKVTIGLTSDKRRRSR